QPGRAHDDSAHGRDRVHVDPGPRRGYVDRGAEPRRRRERLGDRFEEYGLGSRGALVDERREAAYEVDSDVVRGLVDGAREADVIGLAAGFADGRKRRDGDALVGDGDTELGAYVVDGGDEFGCVRGDLVADGAGD